MEQSVFRKESLERVNSPEQLNEYIRVPGPSVWLVVGALALLLLGVSIWGVFGAPELRQPDSGEAVAELLPEETAENSTEQ